MIKYESCAGKPGCSLNASNSVFGDPCWGMVKYLEVIYECASGKGDSVGLSADGNRWVGIDGKLQSVLES